MPDHHSGWKAIASAVGVSDRSARNLAARPVDPLPVFKVGGIVRLRQRDLDAWIDRQRAAGLGGSGGGSAAIEEHW